MSQPERVAEALRVIQRTADKQGNVTMLRLAENLANDAALVRLAQSEALRTARRSPAARLLAIYRAAYAETYGRHLDALRLEREDEILTGLLAQARAHQVAGR